jgi:Tfp pilus assembly protein PilF
MAEIYRKSGKREEASDTLYQLALLKVNAKDFQHAKTLLDDAVRLNGKNEEAKKERDRIKLELTYQSLQPQEKVEAPASAPQESDVKQ